MTCAVVCAVDMQSSILRSAEPCAVASDESSSAQQLCGLLTCPAAQSNHPQYVDDCQRLYKFIFPHDDSVNDRTEGGKLDRAWQTTNVRSQPVDIMLEI